jgi:hypothetical protein
MSSATAEYAYYAQKKTGFVLKVNYRSEILQLFRYDIIR